MPEFTILKQSDNGRSAQVAFLILTPAGENNAGVSYQDIAKEHERGVSVVPGFATAHPGEAAALANGVGLERVVWVNFDESERTLEERRKRIMLEYAKTVVEVQRRFVNIWENYKVEP